MDGVRKYVKRHSNGVWYVRKYLGTNPVNGRKMEAYKTLSAKDYDGAVREAAAFLANLTKNPLVPVGLDDFIRAKERTRAPANTVATYRTCANYLRPFLARIRVRDLSTAHVNEAYMELLDHGAANGDPLSSATVRTVNAFLSAAYKWLMGQGLADANPTDNATLPPKDVNEAQALDEASLAVLLDVIGAALANPSTDEADVSARLVAFAARTALYTGMRVGEVCGLRRSDVHALQSYVHVCGTVVVVRGMATYQPKTKGKRSRNVAVEPADLAAIRAHERWQDGLFKARPTSPLVSAHGGFLSPRAVSAMFRVMASEAGLPDWCHFHTLRHTHATMLLQAGADINTVQERLGHASASTTLNTYGHVLPGRDREIARQFHATMGLVQGTP